MIRFFVVITSNAKGRLKKTTFLVSGTFSRLTEQLCATLELFTFGRVRRKLSVGLHGICIDCCLKESTVFNVRTGHISV